MSAPAEFERPEPRRLLKDDPLINKLVVEAIANEE